MSALHVHGRVTPTSRVVRTGRAQKSPLDALSPRKRPARAARTPSSRIDDAEAREADVRVPVSADFRGIDILSAMTYLKRLATELPPRTSRERRTELLNRRRNLPDLVLAHQIASLFPAMPDLEREIHGLVDAGRIVPVPLQDGDLAYIRTEDLDPPAGLLEAGGGGGLATLSEDDVRRFSQAGFLLRRGGALVLGAPNMGSFLAALRSARKWVLAHVRKGLVLEADLRSRYEAWRDGGIFQFEALMHDMVGSGRVEMLNLTVGRALRITKRGREDR